MFGGHETRVKIVVTITAQRGIKSSFPGLDLVYELSRDNNALYTPYKYNK